MCNTLPAAFFKAAVCNILQFDYCFLSFACCADSRDPETTTRRPFSAPNARSAAGRHSRSAAALGAHEQQTTQVLSASARGPLRNVAPRPTIPTMNFSGTGTRRLSLTGMMPTAGNEGVESTHRIEPPPPGLEFAR